MSRYSIRKEIHIPKNMQFFVHPVITDKKLLLSPQDVIQYAKANGYMKGYIINIKELIKTYDDIDLKFIDNLKSDATIQYDLVERKFNIVINGYLKSDHKRFMTAYMLFIYLGRHRIDRNDYEDGNVHEHQCLYTNHLYCDSKTIANISASQVLMPLEEFKEALIKYKLNLSSVAEKFKVSTLAVRYRASNLGYSTKKLVNN